MSKEEGARKYGRLPRLDLESLVVDLALALMRLLSAGATVETRAAAAYVLGFGRFSGARGALEAALDNVEESPSVRGHAAEALAYIHNRESVDVLLEHLQDQDAGVKYWCAFALGQIGDRKALPSLKHLAENAGDQMYKTHSLRAEIGEAIAAINTAAPGQATPDQD
jgi:HEAT repeat protein